MLLFSLQTQLCISGAYSIDELDISLLFIFLCFIFCVIYWGDFVCCKVFSVRIKIVNFYWAEDRIFMSAGWSSRALSFFQRKEVRRRKSSVMQWSLSLNWYMFKVRRNLHFCALFLWSWLNFANMNNVYLIKMGKGGVSWCCRCCCCIAVVVFLFLFFFFFFLFFVIAQLVECSTDNICIQFFKVIWS